MWHFFIGLSKIKTVDSAQREITKYSPDPFLVRGRGLGTRLGTRLICFCTCGCGFSCADHKLL